MNEKQTTTTIVVSESTFKILLKELKPFILPFVLIVFSILAFYFIVYPQVQDVLKLKDQETAIKSDISKLSANQAVISSINDNDYKNDIDILTRAMPEGKDYTGVIKAIAAAANGSSVPLDSYSLAVGNLATLSANLSTQSSLSVALQVNSNPQSVQRFSSELLKSVPLCEITSLNTNGISGGVSTAFFYQPYIEQTFNPLLPIVQVNSADLAIINQIKDWENIQDTNYATASSQLSLSPTPTPTPIPSLTPSPESLATPSPTLAP